MLEKTIEQKVAAFAKTKKVLAYKWVSPQNAGVCDHIFIYQGRTWFVEFKQFGKRPTPLQAAVHQKLVRQGVHVYVVDSVEIGRKVIDYEIGESTERPDRAIVRLLEGS